ncbi:MAG: hypothetical protein IKW74_07830, partial [Thermoguttaceae bacterium]|nr:hypothetical protein [Thermoguttaceae bacterium]
MSKGAAPAGPGSSVPTANEFAVRNDIAPGSNGSADIPVESGNLGSQDGEPLVGSVVTDIQIDKNSILPRTITVPERKFSIPFSVNSQNSDDPPSEIELIYSPDNGTTWLSYGKVSANDGKKAFGFQTPADGEFLFVLRTNFQSGKQSVSPIQKIIIDAKNNAANTLYATGNGAVSGSSPLSEAEQRQVSERLLKLANGSGNGATSEAAAGNTVDQTVFPGKINSLSTTKPDENGNRNMVVRWVQPEETEGGTGTLRIERATGINGPWIKIVDQLDAKQIGYSWPVTSEPGSIFYLRTIYTAADGTQWTDISPQLEINSEGKLTLIKPVNENSQNAIAAATASNSLSGSSNDSHQNNIASWDSSENNENSISQTSSVSGVSSSSGGNRAASGTQNQVNDLSNTRMDVNNPYQYQTPRPNIPAPTNPGEFTLNPLFTQ